MPVPWTDGGGGYLSEIAAPVMYSNAEKNKKAKRGKPLDKRFTSMLYLNYTKRSEGGKMKAIEIVKALMKEKDMTNGKLGSAIERNGDVVNKRLNQKELSAGVLAEMVSPMGYKVVVMPATEKTPNGAYVVDAGKVGKAGERCDG